MFHYSKYTIHCWTSRTRGFVGGVGQIACRCRESLYDLHSNGLGTAQARLHRQSIWHILYTLYKFRHFSIAIANTHTHTQSFVQSLTQPVASTLTGKLRNPNIKHLIILDVIPSVCWMAFMQQTPAHSTTMSVRFGETTFFVFFFHRYFFVYIHLTTIMELTRNSLCTYDLWVFFVYFPGAYLANAATAAHATRRRPDRANRRGYLSSYQVAKLQLTGYADFCCCCSCMFGIVRFRIRERMRDSSDISDGADHAGRRGGRHAASDDANTAALRSMSGEIRQTHRTMSQLFSIIPTGVVWRRSQRDMGWVVFVMLPRNCSWNVRKYWDMITKEKHLFSVFDE